MREIITKIVKEGHFFNRRKTTKIGVEGAPLHDMLVSQSDNKLACFNDNKDGKYYMYSLVDGSLIATSLHFIECLSDNYFEMYDETGDNLILCCVDYDTNTYEIINKNYDNYVYERNILVEYEEKFKKVIITNMDNKERYEFVFPNLPDSKFKNILIIYNIDIQVEFMINIIFSKDIEYFNFFDINTKKFTFDKFFKGNIYDVQEYNGEIYIITDNNELLDIKGKILIDSLYDCIYFWDDTLPQYIVLKKGGMYGLFDLENGKFIFEVKYDEIIKEGNLFKAASKTYTTYEIQ